MRVTGNTAWLEKRDWKNFVDYEQEINRVIGKYQMIVICTYLLAKCGASEVIDVVRNHQFAVIKREGEWQLIESSELKQAKETLRKSEEKFRGIAERNFDAIALLDADGRFTYVSPALEKVTGFRSKELLATHFQNYLLQSDLPKAFEAFSRITRGENDEGMEVRLRRKDGTIITVESNCSPIFEDGKLVGDQAIFRDITKRKEAEESLRESEQRFRCLVEDAGAGVGIIDLKGRFTYVNKTLADSLGYSVQELAGRPFKDFLHPNDRGKVVRLFLKSILLRRPLQNLEFRVIHKDGHVLHCVSKPTRLIIDGKTVGFQAIIIDITERKKAEAKIKQAYEEWKRTFDAISDFAFIVDRDYRLVRVNKAVCDALRKEPKELIGKRCFEAVHGTDKPWPNCPHTKTLATGKATTEEINDPNLGLPLLVTNSPIFDNKGELTGAVHLAKDITERKKTEEALKRYSEYLENIFATSPDAITVSDRNGNVIQCNKATLDMLGFSSKEELIGQNGFSFIAKRDRQKAAEYLKKT